MNIIETEGLSKSFLIPRVRRKVQAVCDLRLRVSAGSIFGFLGPNGAGKTTTQRMLTTLLVPDGGSACIAGYDLVREPERVRRHIGAVSQSGGTDRAATGRENLLLQAQLHGLAARAARIRTDELIAHFELTEIADRVVYGYSGGQRRRLDLALGMVHRPALLFLDEPGTGLDPQSRAHLWDEIRTLHAAGTTIFLTTHQLDEADALCNRLAIIDHGTLIAEGSPAELKQRIAGDIITLHLKEHELVLTRAQELLRQQPYVREIHPDATSLQVYVEQGETALALVLRLLDDAQLPVSTVALTRPSLDDVFLRLTGRTLRETQS